MQVCPEIDAKRKPKKSNRDRKKYLSRPPRKSNPDFAGVTHSVATRRLKLSGRQCTCKVQRRCVPPRFFPVPGFAAAPFPFLLRGVSEYQKMQFICTNLKMFFSAVLLSLHRALPEYPADSVPQGKYTHQIFLKFNKMAEKKFITCDGN